MRVLFDQGTPVPLRALLSGHDVSTAYELGWSGFSNGELLDSAEGEGYEGLGTTDTNLRHQQDLGARSIAVVVLRSASWPRIQRVVPAVIEAIEATKPGSCTEVEVP
jgi:hypothetical protein